MSTCAIIVGGGIAGVTCAKTLAFHKPDLSIILISESPLIKTVVNLKFIGKMITTFDVKERPLNSLTDDHPNIKVLQDSVIKINDKNCTILTKTNQTLNYTVLCLCTGGKPKLITQSDDDELVVGIRDTDSVENFVQKLQHSKRVAVVGNGGIASELVYKMQNVEIDWIVKDKHISATFVDPGAAEFFQSSLLKSAAETPSVTRRMRYNEESGGSGAALGPDWYKNLDIKGANTSQGSIKIHYESEVEDIIHAEAQSEFPLKIRLKNSSDAIRCDLVVSATGVKPNSAFATETPLSVSEQDGGGGGILIDEKMRTSIAHVYAAGDVATPNWPHAKHWFPMRLWSQAAQMGTSAAQCMMLELQNEDDDGDGSDFLLQNFCYELFTHTTSLFGYQVVLLGLYNGQKLGDNYEILLRTTPKKEYIKFVLEDNRLQGVVLIGDTGLEETCENLILNQTDLSPYGDDILDPDIDIEDYFD